MRKIFSLVLLTFFWPVSTSAATDCVPPDRNPPPAELKKAIQCLQDAINAAVPPPPVKIACNIAAGPKSAPGLRATASVAIPTPEEKLGAWVAGGGCSVSGSPPDELGKDYGYISVSEPTPQGWRCVAGSGAALAVPGSTPQFQLQATVKYCRYAQ